MKEQSLKKAMESFKIESKAIANIADYLDVSAFKKAVEVLCTCNKIITCASGTSGIAAKKMAHSLCCVERDAFFMSPAAAVHGGLGGLKKDDAMIMVSRGGGTVELFPIIDVCKKKGATLIAITENLDSHLAKSADIVLPLKIGRESDKYNVMATASFVATIALFDAMLVAIIEETNYQLEQFGLIHPGGAVGALLNKDK
ncbi:MAG TPA: SIS domain-containing protein [Thermoanaerobacterales bacterium]|nr:SIS domain-containing protein [Thermoanaerobacterales bacterium]